METDMSEIRGQHVLITGGASGIGAWMAKYFAEEKAGLVLIWDINQQALEEMRKHWTYPDTTLLTEVCDISDYETVRVKAESFLREYQHLDILINNAGYVSGKTILENSPEAIRKTLDINVLAHFWTIKAFLPAMLRNGFGHIVTIASAGGLIGVHRLSDYSASKFAVFGLDESIRMEARRMNWPIRTTVVCPYYIDTGMFKGVKTRFPLLLPILKPEKVAAKIIQAIKKDRKRVFMPAMVYTVPLLRILPVSLFDWIADFFGINHSMDEFVGRHKFINH